MLQKLVFNGVPLLCEALGVINASPLEPLIQVLDEEARRPWQSDVVDTEEPEELC